MELSTVACIEEDHRTQQSHLLRRDYIRTKFAHRVGELADAMIAKRSLLEHQRVRLVGKAGNPACPQKTLAKILNVI
jgi:hypothetical protein